MGPLSESVVIWSWLSPTLIVTGALLLIVLERAFPYDRRQRFLRPGFATDLFYYALMQSWVLGLVIGWLASGIDGLTGLSHLHLISAWPIPMQVAFFVVSHDLYIYCFHRLQHRSPLLWRIHETHHATHDIDWLSGSRSHPVEILINQTIEFVPMMLLGAAPEVALIKVTIDILWGMYIHSNIDIRSGRLQRILNGPEMHRWHHAIEINTGVNFATKFALWDWLFGSAYLPAEKPSGYGLADPFPTVYLAQVTHAFTSRRKHSG
jgi:sterol desaturase/sphingolipid hydroxylase (fatty acid hydroxylase superfamily)